MKKLNYVTVSLIFLVLFLIGVFIFTVVLNGWAMGVAFLGFIALMLVVMVGPYGFTYAWNKYIATDDEGEESDGSDESQESS